MEGKMLTSTSALDPEKPKMLKKTLTKMAATFARHKEKKILTLDCALSRICFSTSWLVFVVGFPYVL